MIADQTQCRWRCHCLRTGTSHMTKSSDFLRKQDHMLDRAALTKWRFSITSRRSLDLEVNFTRSWKLETSWQISQIQGLARGLRIDFLTTSLNMHMLISSAVTIQRYVSYRLDVSSLGQPDSDLYKGHHGVWKLRIHSYNAHAPKTQSYIPLHTHSLNRNALLGFCFGVCFHRRYRSKTHKAYVLHRDPTAILPSYSKLALNIPTPSRPRHLTRSWISLRALHPVLLVSGTIIPTIVHSLVREAIAQAHPVMKVFFTAL
jgi:hypothetical protein